MAGPKYVADGFEEDFTKLLNEFVEECSVEFVDFARIWRDNHFSLVFMGRPFLTETSEFTNEIFRITSHFLSSPSFFQRIGAVYTLYALYRNQIADPPIKIRIDMSHWRAMKSLYVDAISKRYKSLLYVIDYLIKYALVFVADQTLRGPLTGSTPKTSKDFQIVSTMKSVYKSDLIEYSASNNLEALKNLHREYLNVKKDLGGEVNASLNGASEVYQVFISDLNKLVNPTHSRTKGEASESLGARRSKLKAKSFLKKAIDRYGQAIEDDEDVGDPDNRKSSSAKRRNKKKRTPKKKGNVGRPPKNKIPEVEVEEESKSEDDNIDISHLLEQQNDFFLPPDEENKKLKSKPGRYYYKLSPKREKEED